MRGRMKHGLVAGAVLGIAACGEAGHSARRIEVHMTDANVFGPAQLSVTVGDTIEFINDGTAPHTATDTPGPSAVADHNVLPAGAEPWDSGIIDAQKRFTVVLTAPGVYKYRCGLHESMGMLGEITVAPGPQ